MPSCELRFLTILLLRITLNFYQTSLERYVQTSVINIAKFYFLVLYYVVIK